MTMLDRVALYLRTRRPAVTPPVLPTPEHIDSDEPMTHDSGLQPFARQGTRA